jgi:hypothetical protein
LYNYPYTIQKLLPHLICILDLLNGVGRFSDETSNMTENLWGLLHAIHSVTCQIRSRVEWNGIGCSDGARDELQLESNGSLFFGFGALLFRFE